MTPAGPAPAEPTPGERTRAEPAPGERTPAEPTPAERTPGERTRAEPAPAEPAPAEPTAGERTPAEPTSTEPAPAEPPSTVPAGRPAGLPDDLPPDLVAYLAELTERVHEAFGDDLLGVWLIGSAAQSAYQPGISDIDVLAVTGHRWPEAARRSLGEAVRHPALRCPAVGLEFVVYALPDLTDLADPVAFALNVNGGEGRAPLLALGPDDGPGWWAVLHLAAARAVGIPLLGPAPGAVLPSIPRARLIAAIRESQAWHDRDDTASTNRALNLARLIVLLTDGRWLSKPAGARALADLDPGLAPVLHHALQARADRRDLEPGAADPLSARLRELTERP